ncbi:MAG: hypothetical protein APF81_21705 [Desulfosporosinus sp. BRH_c37]|nr:MAG: hypothetical protein APF81_21705 [Desulfosporosinus sp. BRH_c37]
MTKEQFAKQNGFESYNKLLIASTSIIFDHGINYYVTQTSNGWMAWIDEDPVKAIAWFDNFELAQAFLIVAFRTVIDHPVPYPLVSETNNSGSNY